MADKITWLLSARRLLRSKRVFWTFPIGEKRKNTLGIEFYNFGFLPPFWVGFSKQRKKPGSRRSSNCFQNAFFQLSPSGRNEKTPLGSNFKISVSCHHFGWAFPSSGKSRVDEGRPIAFKTWEASHAPSVVGQSGARKSASSSSSSSSSSSLSCRVDVDVVPSGLHIAPALGFFFFIGTLKSVSRSFLSRSVLRPSTIPTSLVLPPSFRAKT